MRYGPDIVKEIVAELERVPIIRQVCQKMGIDHSTFYRWMIKHPSFLKEAMAALWLGRRRMNDTAESVVIGKIQNQDLGASKYWLSHNDQRYMGLDKGRHHEKLVDQLMHVFSDKLPDDYPTTFEKIFELFRDYEDHLGWPAARKFMEPVIELLCRDDPKLVDIFYATYEGWKKEKKELGDQIKKTGVSDEDEEDIEENLGS